jgi:rubredoxin
MDYIDPEDEILAGAKQATRNIVITTSCPTCGKSYTEKMPWFDTHDFKCPTCGVHLDKKPFIEMDERASKRLQKTLKRFKL